MPSQNLNDLTKIFNENKKNSLTDFYKFLRFQSISSEIESKSEVTACADWVMEYLCGIGFDIQLWETIGHPTIFASYLKAGPHQPTLLIYNHYDVQPVDPLNLWDSPPFEPSEREGNIYARGAQDNKGQCFYVLLALKTLIETYGTLPINIKLCIEGEEECGSTGISKILEEKKEALKADYLAIVDVGINNATSPAITLGIRGIVTMDLEITCSHSDLHSGSHGGIAFNPLHALVKLLDSVRDESGKITIPGFYEDIIPLTDFEKQQICWDFNSVDYEKEIGTQPTGGEHAYTPLERNWIRPTLEINGINGGYWGEGFKTVIPAKASAKISCRLVANQNPEKVGSLVASYFESNAPQGTTATVHIHSGKGKAVTGRIDSAAVKAFSQAYEEIFDKPCEFIYAGGSIPIVTELALASEAEVVMVGLGLDSDNIHAPNENFSVKRIEQGFLSIARVIQLLEKK